MACPTCDHTMQNLGGTAHKYFWCPRCGTLREGTDSKMEFRRDTTPLLVNRVRRFGTDIACKGEAMLAYWIQHGIAESINLPNNRPTPGGLTP